MASPEHGPRDAEITPAEQALFVDAVRQLAGPLVPFEVHITAEDSERSRARIAATIAQLCGLGPEDKPEAQRPKAEAHTTKGASANRSYIFGSGEVTCFYTSDGEADLSLSELRKTDQPGVVERHSQSYGIYYEGPSFGSSIDILYPDGREDPIDFVGGALFTSIHFQHCILVMTALMQAIEEDKD